MLSSAKRLEQEAVSYQSERQDSVMAHRPLVFIRFNSTDTVFEGYNGTEWGSIGGGGPGPRWRRDGQASSEQTKIKLAATSA